jgi:type IV pilus assembly protein PilM
MSKKLLAIDWDARNLRLVLVRPRGEGLELVKAVSIPVPAEVKLDDPEATGAFLREAMRQARISVKSAVMSIPRDQVVLNTLGLPPTPVEEMSALVQFQIVKELPFAADQATVDFAVGAGFDPKEPCTVLVAAIRNEQLAFYRQVAHEAGLSIERIGLRPYANLHAVTARAPDLRDKTFLLIEIGPQLTEIDIIKQGSLVFSRAASVSLPDYRGSRSSHYEDSRISAMEVADQEPEEVDRRAVNALMVEIVRSFEAHRATDAGISIDQIVVCGASGLEPQLGQVLAARFATQAELYTPERALDLTAQRAKELRGFSAAIGLAMGSAQRGLAAFDFLHPKKPVSKRQVRLKKVPIAVATGLLFIGAGATSYAKFVLPKQEQIKVMDERIEPKRKQAKVVRDFKAQVETLESWRDSEQYWPEVLIALTENFPPDDEAAVTRLDFESRPKPRSSGRESRMVARLRTASLGKVNEIITKLGEWGCKEVKSRKESPISGRREAGIYSYETDVEAILPTRSKPSAKGKDASTEEEEFGSGLRSGSRDATSPTNGAGLPRAEKPQDKKPADAKDADEPAPDAATPAEPEQPTSAPAASPVPTESKEGR